MSYLKRDLPGEDKQELLGLTEDYRQELVPLIVPLTLRNTTCGAIRCRTGCTSRYASTRIPRS
jgi:hypothetical protein